MKFYSHTIVYLFCKNFSTQITAQKKVHQPHDLKYADKY